MTREAGLCCGLSTTMASRLAPGRHDASCTLVVKLNSATRLLLLAGQPTKQFATAEQVAAIALFLCRDEASQITGANISIDGGWTAW